jgi:hypothetical protein
MMDVLAPGFVAMVLAEVGPTSLPGLPSSYRERILRHLAVTPVSPTRLLAAYLLGAQALLAIGSVLAALAPTPRVAEAAEEAQRRATWRVSTRSRRWAAMAALEVRGSSSTVSASTR